MNTEVLIHNLKLHARLLQYPVSLLKQEEILFSVADAHFLTPFLKEITQKEELSYFFSSASVFYGVLPYEGMHIVIGPCTFLYYSKEDEKKLRAFYGVEYSVNEDLSSLSKHSFYKLIEILVSLDGFLDGTIRSPEEITSPANEILFDAMSKEADDFMEEEKTQSGYEYEQMLLHYVKEGNTEEIEQFSAYQGEWNPEVISLRRYKNSLMILNSLCLRKAIEAGVDRDSAFLLGELYQKKIENASNTNELLTLNLNHAIAKNYALLVKKIAQEECSSSTIRNVRQYVRNHYREKLTVAHIAKQFYLSPEYLSSLFIKECRISLPEYIRSLKINQAKVLLKFTDRSLIDISSLLSFSSQSYFQTVFRRETGMTPQYFRLHGEC